MWTAIRRRAVSQLVALLLAVAGVSAISLVNAESADAAAPCGVVRLFRATGTDATGRGGVVDTTPGFWIGSDSNTGGTVVFSGTDGWTFMALSGFNLRPLDNPVYRFFNTSTGVIRSYTAHVATNGVMRDDNFEGRNRPMVTSVLTPGTWLVQVNWNDPCLGSTSLQIGSVQTALF
jgi:hypothetical protein